MRRAYSILVIAALAASVPAFAQDEEEPKKKSFDVMGDDEEPEEEEPEVVAPKKTEPEPEPEPELEPAATPPAPVPAGPKALVLVVGTKPADTGTALRIGKAATLELAKARTLSPIDLEALVAPGTAAQREADIKAGLAGVEKGLAAFGELELDAAGTELESAINMLLSHSDDLDARAKSSLETAMFAFAATTLFAGQTDLAESIFTALLVMSPRYTPDGEQYPSNVIARFTELKARVEQLPTGALTVNTVPRGSDVYVDGTFRGPSPVEVGGLADGQHVIVVKRLGYKPYGTLAPVSAEHAASIDVDLEVMPDAPLEKELRPELANDLQAALQFGKTAGIELLCVLALDTGLAGAKVRGQWLDVTHGVLLAKIPESAILTDPDVAAKTIVQAIAAAEAAPLVASAEPESDGGSVIESWWFWTIVGAVAVAGGGAAVLAATSGSDRGPPRNGVVLGF